MLSPHLEFYSLILILPLYQKRNPHDLIDIELHLFQQLLITLFSFMLMNLNFRSNNSNYWLGLRNSSNSQNAVVAWTWTDGSPFTNRISFWGEKFPSGKFDCGSLSATESAAQIHGHWEDEHCDKPMRYICRKGRL